MKTTLLIFTLLIFSLGLHSQTFSKSINKDIVVNQKIFIDGSGTTHQLTKNYYVRAEKDEATDYLIIDLISDDPDNADDTQKKESFKIYPLSIEVFSTSFKQAYKDLVEKSELITVDSSTQFKDLEISLLFVELIAFERTENERPVVANITLKKNIPVKIKYKYTPQYNREIEDLKLADDATDEAKKEKDKKRKALEEEGDGLVELCKINSAKLELTFYNGFIEKIELEAEIKSAKVRFTNLYSIGISSTSGIRKFVKNNIQSFYSYKEEAGDTLVRDSEGSMLSINFADVIDYDREIDINANDISPEPTKLVLTSLDDKTVLYKEESTKLFEAIVYSDFLGVFDAENPNGILQTEVAKKFYINTNRGEVSKIGSYLLSPFLPALFAEGYGFFEYLDVSAKISKLEENNKFLNADTLNGEWYFSPLKIMQHESFSIGADLNILYLENQNKKINTNFDIGLRYGRSGLQIDENTQEFFNSITTTAKLGFQFIPEKRYGFLASIKAQYFQIYNDDGFNVMSLNNNSLVRPNQWFNQTQFQFFVNTSTTGKLFIRYNLMTEMEDWDNNFSQFQFGYSFYLLKQNEK
ncbi:MULTISPECIES: hypothetical protein [Winogradskyella]|uniref:hypothetical protein n=1 Tax=Winogradskyella TaxID=286104 RepID=UPI0015C85805|nr:MULTISPECIES: hypothetical protein [Winogradskyella]QXP78301.1 hypothetical protein H0I32_13915 [Winogradskyella sp. HaHa_3_26]